MIQVTWQGGLAFAAMAPSGAGFVMDALPEFGGAGKGLSPVEALMASAAACSAMDVMSILHKKHQVVTSYRLEVEAVRAPEGAMPRPVTQLTLRHIVGGTELDAAAVARSVELSDTKYCTVIATLRGAPQVTSLWELESPSSSPQSQS